MPVPRNVTSLTDELVPQRYGFLMGEVKARCQVAIVASQRQILRMRRAIDASRRQVDYTADRILESERLLARTAANEDLRHDAAAARH